MSLGAWLLAVVLVAAGPPHTHDRGVRAGDALAAAASAFGQTAVQGGYARSVAVADGTRFGARQLAPGELVVGPDGTTAAGRAYLAAFAATGEPSFRAAALAAAKALAGCQRESGGWTELADTAGTAYTRARAAAGELPGERDNRTDLAEPITPAALRLLLDVAALTGDAEVRTAADHGLLSLLRAQRADGAWPAGLPLTGPEDRLATLQTEQGAVTPALVSLLLHAGSAWPQARPAALRGAAFLLSHRRGAKVVGWACAYDAAGVARPDRVDLRATVAALQALADLRQVTGELRFGAAATEVLRLLPVGPPWPPAYDAGGSPAGTDPWRDWGLPAAAEAVRAAVRGREPDNSRAARAWRTSQRAPQVAAVLAALDAQSRWVEHGVIATARFAANLELLADFVREYEPIPLGLLDDDSRPAPHRR